MGDNKPVILVVDDSSISLAVAEHELKDRYQVVTINSGIRALQYLKHQTADLILLDIQMALKNGIETLKEIREMEECKDIPVIMLTSKGDKETILESSKLGIYDYILKPFKRQELLDRIQRTLYDKRQLKG